MASACSRCATASSIRACKVLFHNGLLPAHVTGTYRLDRPLSMPFAARTRWKRLGGAWGRDDQSGPVGQRGEGRLRGLQGGLRRGAARSLPGGHHDRHRQHAVCRRRRLRRHPLRTPARAGVASSRPPGAQQLSFAVKLRLAHVMTQLPSPDQRALLSTGNSKERAADNPMCGPPSTEANAYISPVPTMNHARRSRAETTLGCARSPRQSGRATRLAVIQ